jgi:hypothetical protein
MLLRNTQRVLMAALAVSSGLRADNKKTVEDQHIELIRGLTSEYATAKNGLPQAAKPLDFNADGTWDVVQWTNSARIGIAARVGDLVQVTRVGIGKDTLLLEINGGLRGKHSFWDHVQAGSNVGISGGPVNGPPTNAPAGTAILVHFKGTIGDVTSSDVKKILKPMLDFEKHSATENFVDTLPPEVQKAIKDKKVIEGMDRDEVLLALGRPLRKTRETKDGTELEDWLYGEPPGRVTFVTFNGNKVVRVKDDYAGLGGSIVETKPVN